MTINIYTRPDKADFAFLSGDGDCLNYGFVIYDPSNEGFTTDHVINLLDELVSHACELHDLALGGGSTKFQIMRAAGVSFDNGEFDQYETLQSKTKINLRFR